jgi:hypothetical protein
MGAVKNRNFLTMPEIEPRIIGHPARSLVTISTPVYTTTESSSVPALQPCVGLDALHGFITVSFYWAASSATRRTPNLEDYGLHFV